MCSHYSQKWNIKAHGSGCSCVVRPGTFLGDGFISEGFYVCEVNHKFKL